MKYFRQAIILSLAALLLLAGCGRPRTIPRRTMAQIFKEAYITNAYFGTQVFVPTDSVDFYRPILERYGFTVRDFEHTVAEFSKRKNAKLSDIVELAIKELEVELKYYSDRVATIDTIEARATRLFQREVFFAERIEARRIADTAKLRIAIPAEPGTYNISYTYFIDSLDENRTHRTFYYLIDTAGVRHVVGSTYMSAQRRQSVATTTEATDASRTLEIVFGGGREDMKRPYLTIDSLRVEYFLPIGVALDSVVRTFFPIYVPRPVYDEPTAQDSSTLHLDSRGDDPVGGGDD